MIVLITGASHTGKTVLAQKLLERYKYPYFCIDHLKMGLIRSGNTDLTVQGDDALTEYLWPIVREMIKTAIENGQNLIVEGCYVPYNWRADFEDSYLSDIRFICLAMSEEYISSNYGKIMDHGSDIENRPEDPECTSNWFIDNNRKFIEGFKAAGEEVTLISSDYESVIDKLLKSKATI
ncbi:Adenylate kinase [Oscillospiraceae bacterium]|nr:Adenylate kinase [Oscillospiraceae bacterium]